MARSELESSMKSIKYILLIITTMFIVVAALMMTLGISVYSRYHDFRFIFDSASSFLAPSVLVTLTGAFMLVVTLFGFVGSLRESVCLVNMYALILSLLLVLQVVVIAIGFSLDESQIVGYVSIPVSEYTTNNEIRDDIDFTQSSLKCCGSSSFYDYAPLEFTSEHHVVSANVSGASVTIPQTCCYKYVQGEGTGYCEAVWATGCKSAVVALVVQNSGVLGVLAMSVAFIQLLGIIFSILLAKTIRKVKSERAYLRWKVMEQMITARAENNNRQPFVYIQPSLSTKA